MEIKKLPDLNLPSIHVKYSSDSLGNTTIWDIIRKKYIVLTPEEWVRQHFIHLIIHHLDYPSVLFKVEKELRYNKMKKRCDIEVMDRTGENTYLLVECKAPEVKLSNETVTQLSVYNSNKKAKVLAITNGIKHYVWKLDPISENYIAIKDFPRFDS